MARVCCFPGCESKDRSWCTYSFHRIPLRDIGLRQLWLAALNMDICTPPGALKQLRVCSLHFSKDDFVSPPPGKSQRCTLKYTSVPMHQGQNPLTERTGKEIRREEEKKEEAMQDKEPQNARRVKEEQTCEADDVSVVIIPGLTDDGQTETERRAMLPQLVTGGFIKPEPEQCEIDRHGDNSRTSAMTEEEEEQPIVRILKQEAEDMAWETSSHWDTQGQETGNGDDSFLQTKSIKAEPERCEIGCHGATEEEGPIVRTLKREAEDMTWETSSHSDSQEQETGKGDDSSLLAPGFQAVPKLPWSSPVRRRTVTAAGTMTQILAKILRKLNASEERRGKEMAELRTAVETLRRQVESQNDLIQTLQRTVEQLTQTVQSPAAPAVAPPLLQTTLEQVQPAVSPSCSSPPSSPATSPPPPVSFQGGSSPAQSPCVTPLRQCSASLQPDIEQEPSDARKWDISEEVERELYRKSVGCDGRVRPDRFALLLFRAVVPKATFYSWCGKVNFDGSRGKWPLPHNIKAIMQASLDRLFPELLPSDWKRIRDRINENLRSKRYLDAGAGSCS